MKIEKKIAVNDLRAEAQRLIRTNEMPTLDHLLTVIAEVRTKYTPAIKKERERKS